jgi:hypothetical protein
LDVLQDPRLTSTATLTASVACTDPDFTATVCQDGSNDGRRCDTALDCPGGTCGPQCFCAGQAAPNACHSACVDGANDAAPCTADGECPGGFCRAGDCRPDPTDTDSCQEGHCTTGPITGRCAADASRSCTSNTDCAPTDVCELGLQQCFVNGRIERCGAPGVPDRTTAAVYCVPGTGNTAVDATIGAPGPGALTQPETPVALGF